MDKCWTCGEVLENACYTCANCEKILQQNSLKQKLSFIRFELSKNNEKEISDEVIHSLIDVLSVYGLESLSSIIEWGTEKSIWQIQHIPNIYKHILKENGTPGNKMVQENVIDYLSSIEFALEQATQNNFTECRNTLIKSLKIAPNGEKLDYKSYSHRLIAHTYYCESNNFDCLHHLSNALKYSQSYPEAHFDLVQAIGRASSDEVITACSDLFKSWGKNWEVAIQKKDYNLICWLSLSIAIKANPIFYLIASKDSRFDNNREIVQEKLQHHLEYMVRSLEKEISFLSQDLQQLNQRFSRLEDSTGFNFLKKLSKNARRYEERLQEILTELYNTTELSNLKKKLNTDNYLNVLLVKAEFENKTQRVKWLKDKFSETLTSKWYWIFSSPTN